ncbi:MAG: FAD-dependent oxidoreductase [Bacteroidia bacterium]
MLGGLWLAALLMLACKPTRHETCDVLVIGGGASGVAAGIQAARSGAQTLIVEPTPWLGGMLTAAGVSATDGNHQLPSGLWGAFRAGLYAHYGGPDSVSTGWVSHTLFEPRVGDSIWKALAASEPLLGVRYGYRLVQMRRDGNLISGAIFQDESGDYFEVSARVCIDATELGDALALAGESFLTGQDGPRHPHDPNIQDLTYAAIVQDYGVPQPAVEPPGYAPETYRCLCRDLCPDQPTLPTCRQVLDYGRLPRRQFMLNWPNNGNDYYLNPIPLSYAERDSAYLAAKNRTLGFLYFLQTVAGFPNLGLAQGAFPTPDGLPLIPYHREARRLAGLAQVGVADLADPYADSLRPLYRTAVAVGDYPLDHHHQKNPQAQPETYPPIPSFSVPYESLLPISTDGLLVAEKSISVTHQVNGATRLQPCVILIGQAAGAAAALSVQQDCYPRQLPVRTLQQTLLAAGCWLLPYVDIAPDDPDFVAVQAAGLSGWLRGEGIPYKWANMTKVYPDSAALLSDLRRGLGLPPADRDTLLTRGAAVQAIWEQLGRPAATPAARFADAADNTAVAFALEKGVLGWIEGPAFGAAQVLSRRELARLVMLVRPFDTKQPLLNAPPTGAMPAVPDLTGAGT